MKYIIVDSYSIKGAILFGGCIEHAEMASLVLNKYPGAEIESAGFVNLVEPDPENNPLNRHYKAYVNGQSTSLGLRSRAEDAAIIEGSIECH